MSFIVFYHKLVRGLLLSWKLCLTVGDEVDVDFRCWLCPCLYFVGNPLFCHFANVQKWQIEVVWNVSLVKNQATTIVWNKWNTNKWWPYPKLHQIELGMSGIVKQFKCAHCQGSKWILRVWFIPQRQLCLPKMAHLKNLKTNLDHYQFFLPK